MKEAKLKLTEKEYKGEKQYSINLKEMQDGEYIIVEKVFAESKGYPGKVKKKDGEASLIFPCKVKYNDKEVTAWFYEAGHPQYKDFADVGGAMDKIKITCIEEKVVNPVTKVKMLVNRYKYELVE